MMQFKCGNLVRRTLYFLFLLVTVVLIIILLDDSVASFTPEKFLRNFKHSNSSRCDATLFYLNSSLSKCIDGTSPAFYFRKGFAIIMFAAFSLILQLIGFGNGVQKWHVHFEGGGWCYTLESCARRSRTVLGSSKDYLPCVNLNKRGFYFSTNPNANPVLYNFNTVYVRYCDGGSYAGNADRQFNVNLSYEFCYYNKTDFLFALQRRTLYFRGMHNRDDTIKKLLYQLNMIEATDIILSGCSAGGKNTFLLFMKIFHGSYFI